jgi:DNA-binding SARP family transcriptional activator
MNALTLNLLGDLELRRDGQPVALPPSRKTRALLAYLALHARPFSREHLCELFWELPDDPRGSLRWSLSKLRRLVDTPERCRLIADRLSVGLDVSDVDIDVLCLQRLVAGELDGADTASLEAAAVRYRGPLLEGLDLPNFHDFHSWCLAERQHRPRWRIRPPIHHPAWSAATRSMPCCSRPARRWPGNDRLGWCCCAANPASARRT